VSVSDRGRPRVEASESVNDYDYDHAVHVHAHGHANESAKHYDCDLLHPHASESGHDLGRGHVCVHHGHASGSDH